MSVVKVTEVPNNTSSFTVNGKPLVVGASVDISDEVVQKLRSRGFSFEGSVATAEAPAAAAAPAPSKEKKAQKNQVQQPGDDIVGISPQLDVQNPEAPDLTSEKLPASAVKLDSTEK